MLRRRSYENVKRDEPIGFLSLFKYSSKSDKLLNVIGFIFAVCSAGGSITGLIFSANIIQSFAGIDAKMQQNASNISGTKYLNATVDEISADITQTCYGLVAIAIISVLLSSCMVAFFNITAANQTTKIKCLFMKAILRQNIGWFETDKVDFVTQITADLVHLQDGIGEKVCLYILLLSKTFMLIICSLYYGWKLTLYVLCFCPILLIPTKIISNLEETVCGKEVEAYGKAGLIPEEVFSSIKTVSAFGGEGKEIRRYKRFLKKAENFSIKRGVLVSLRESWFWFCYSGVCAFLFWYGIKLIIEGKNSEDPEYKISNLLVVLYCILDSSWSFGIALTYVETFLLAKSAASKVFRIIERIPPINSSSNEGKTPAQFSGGITFKNVHFAYPARPGTSVLEGFSIKIHAGETVALVGPSGCGKSTVIQLLQRFYDSDEGQIHIDGHDIKDLNVGWLRDNLGVVGQEPALFSTTIAENIIFGKTSATQIEIEEAAKSANAHNFISTLPQGYNTPVGENGMQLSGGQKQRIAIARALIKDPAILLLDEATSAMDTENEFAIQKALNQARKQRTTIIVSHRLSAIRSADKIAAMTDRKVVELGTHYELIARRGLYYELVTSQKTVDGVINKLSMQDSTVNVSRLNFCNSNDTRNPQKLYNKCSSSAPVSFKDIEKSVQENPTPVGLRLFRLTLPEWPYIFMGTTTAMIMGLWPLIFGMAFGKTIGILSGDVSQIRSMFLYHVWIFIYLGIGSLILTFMKTCMFSIAGVRLASRLRKLSFKNILRQDLSWFDYPENNVGNLSSRLSSDTSDIQSVSGYQLSVILQALAAFVGLLVIELYYHWKTGLAALTFLPLTFLSVYMEGRMLSRDAMKSKSADDDALKIAVEAIQNIKTVASLHQEELFSSKFETAIASFRRSWTTSYLRGLFYGLSTKMWMFAYAVTLYYGSFSVINRDLFFGNLIGILETLFFAAETIGQPFAFSTNYQRAKISASRIFQLLDQKSRIDPFSNEGEVLKKVLKGIEFRKVQFKYPSRPSVTILDDFKLKVASGQNIAVIGSSGCGKSTCIQLIERFYETNQGKLSVDGKQINLVRVSSLRSQIGLVSQEPVLFNYSLAENIAYGDNSRCVPMEEIIIAAKTANIHDFISSLPKGYLTFVGDQGTQLSGGQKQRVAIARALVRNPKILLLDEATSALDAESEKLVQAALDKASGGRTCITVAHRLSTIQNADVIAVIHEGRVAEKGTHNELLSLRGHYYNLYNMQCTEK